MSDRVYALEQASPIVQMFMNPSEPSSMEAEFTNN